MNKLSTAPRIYPSLAIGVAPAGHDAGRFDYRNRSDAMFNDFLPLDNVRDYIDHSGVYEIVCKANGRCYIGQATSIIRRVMAHLADLDFDRHSNVLLQHDWKRIDRDQFVFRLVVEIPYTDVAELRRVEKKEIELRRTHGIQLYNDFRTVKNPQTELEIAIVEEAQLRQARQDVNVAERDYRELQRQYDAGNKPYQRPTRNVNLSNYEEVTCYDCGAVGGLSLQIFRCDDELLRCERCVDKHLGNMKGWLSKRETATKVSKQWFRRWRLDSANPEVEIMTAISGYVRKFAVKPSVIFVYRETEMPIEKLSERVGIEIKHGKITPRGCVDLPIPEGAKIGVSGRTA